MRCGNTFANALDDLRAKHHVLERHVPGIMNRRNMNKVIKGVAGVARSRARSHVQRLLTRQPGHLNYAPVVSFVFRHSDENIRRPRVDR